MLDYFNNLGILQPIPAAVSGQDIRKGLKRAVKVIRWHESGCLVYSNLRHNLSPNVFNAYSLQFGIATLSAGAHLSNGLVAMTSVMAKFSLDRAGV